MRYNSKWERCTLKDKKYEQALADLKRRPITDFYQLEQSKSGLYCCPICGSGKGTHKTGALKLYDNPPRVQCYANNCFTPQGEDTPGALMRLWDMTLPEVLEKAGYSINTAPSSSPQIKKETPKPEPERKDYTEQYKKWHKTLMESEQALEYIHSRGISDDTAKHFLLGYDPKWIHPTNQDKPNPRTEKRLIIPRTRYSYTARDITGKSSQKYKVISQTLFNSGVLTSETATKGKMPIIVVEGDLDAIAVWQLGYEEVIALGGTGNKDKLITAIKEKNPTAAYIIALDNDKEDEKGNRPGQDTQKYIAEELDAAGIVYISADTADLYSGKKDAGEAALENPDALVERLNSYREQAYNLREEKEKAAELEAYSRSGAGMVDTFLQDIQTGKFKPISSGIAEIDNAVGGGFVRKSIIMLGAAPGMGKTALLSQICENIARRTGEDILYLNLEMSREILLARSIARIANESGKQVVSVNEILRGYEWEKKDGIKEIIMNAAQEYKETIANHLIYNPGEPQTDLDAILKKIEEEKRRIGHAPIVVIDYLQLLTDENNDDSMAIIKRAMQTMRNYANDNETLVFMITANNRDSMKTGQSGLNSGRDSSNIEYGADLHLGLEYAAVSTTMQFENGEITIKQGKSLDYINALKREYALLTTRDRSEWSEEEKLLEENYKKYCTSFVLRVNKNRFLESERIAKLIFEGASARFLPLDTRHETYKYNAAQAFKKVESTDTLPF